MKRGKDLPDPKGQPTKPEAPKEVPVLMFVMVETVPGAFTLRLVCNEDVLGGYPQARCSRHVTG
jgi:hypothetical protein